MARKKARSKQQQKEPGDSRTVWGKLHYGFGLFAQAVSKVAARPATFLLAVCLILTWALVGPIFDFSNTWQLVVNTGTTIVTFLMVFLIQNTQNRDTLAIQLKLSELILSLKGVPDKFAAIEDLSDDELEALHDKCRRQAEQTLEHLNKRKASSKS